MSGTYIEIPINKIEVDLNANPRKEMEDSKSKIEYLAENIEKISLMNPIIVTKIAEDKYKLIAGYRRLEAFVKLHTKYQEIEECDNKYSKIPAHVIENISETFFLSLSENLARKDMTENEKAIAIYIYKENGKGTMRDIGNELGVSKSYVNKLYQLGKELVNPAIKSNTFTESKKYNLEDVNRIMTNTTRAVELINIVSELDTEKKVDLIKSSKAVVKELQNLIIYIREIDKQLLGDEEVNVLLKEQNKVNKLKNHHLKATNKRGRPKKDALIQYDGNTQ